ncbi:hypothetical protein ACXR0O_13715 [Verrucomicrobiota bacterium sgz303538]
MTSPQRALWNLIAVKPRKWKQSPWGDDGGGFWVVALAGERCLYFNDIEDGFNWSRFSTYGTIDEYWCNQSELRHVVSALTHSIFSS